MNLLNIHTHQISTSPNSIYSCSPHEYIDSKILNSLQSYSVGLHPWYLDASWASAISKLENALLQENVLAIGECGLDTTCETPINIQIEAFTAQIKLANKYNKPIIIHCVKQYQEITELYRFYAQTPWIIHGFRGKPQLAKQLIKEGFFLSLGKGIERLEETIKAIPLESLFLETDVEDTSIEEKYMLVCKFKKLDLEALNKQIGQNAYKVFKLHIG